MKYLICLATILAVQVSEILSNDQVGTTIRTIPEDAKLTTPELIRKYGYPVEIHSVTTPDGYILEIHRIPHGKNGKPERKRTALLQHGLLCSSADWLTPGPEKGLGYILADAGYDVWMPNSRGNRYSRKHTHLDPDKNAKQFWDFSWHEIGVYDLPASIDYILEQTQEEKIFYIGQSQGTTVYYVMGSERPEYNKKISVMVSLAPIAYMKRMFSPIIRIISQFQGVLEPISKWVGLYEFLPHSQLLGVVSGVLCGDDSVFQVLCTNSMFAMVGFNRKQMNASLIPIITGHLPAGASTKQILHYGQLHKSGKFRQYDYGKLKNKKLYGSFSPPKYSLRDVSTPIYVFYSRNDWMSHPKDVLKLTKELGNLLGKFLVPDNKFNHADYLFGIDAPKQIYNRVISLLERH